MKGTNSNVLKHSVQCRWAQHCKVRTVMAGVWQGAANDRSICERMPCYVSELKQCHARTEQRAANGTTCADRMVSYSSQTCVSTSSSRHRCDVKATTPKAKASLIADVAEIILLLRR